MGRADMLCPTRQGDSGPAPRVVAQGDAATHKDSIVQ